MKRDFFRFACCAALTVAGLCQAGEKRPPEGRIENDSVVITATVVSNEQVKQEFGQAMNNQYTVLDVQVSPKDGRKIGVHLDDFILRSEYTGDHSGPLVAAQIAGDGALVVSRTYGARSNPDMPQMLESTRVEMKNGGGQKPLMDALSKRMLPEGEITTRKSGLLFFPLQKEKTRNLVLSYETADGSKLRTQFR